jgi:hypothetical protein
MSAVDVSGCVLVPIERLRALEALETEMLTKKTAEEHDADRFKMLRERDKANPELASKRALKYYEANKEEINARRREAYKAKKAAKA